MFAHRRPFAIDGGPPALADPSRPYDPRHDIAVIDPAWHVGIARSTNWDVTVRIDNPRVAFRDLVYVTTYRDQAGRVVEERHEVIKDIFQPGEERRLDVNDGYVRTSFTNATFEIVAAEALIPYAGSSRN